MAFKKFEVMDPPVPFKYNEFAKGQGRKYVLKISCLNK